MAPAAPEPHARDRSAAKSASRAAALVVAVLAMVVEIAPAVFLMAGGGSLATVLANAPVEGGERNAAVRETRPSAELVLERSMPGRDALATAPDRRPTAPGLAALLRRLDLPPPAAA